MPDDAPVATLRPHVGFARGEILDIVPWIEGGYALSTEAGVELLDAALASRGVIATPATGSLVGLADGRLLIRTRNGLLESIAGCPFAPIASGAFLEVVPTPEGVIAGASDQVIVDVRGVRGTIRVASNDVSRVFEWRDRIVHAGSTTGVTVLERDGRELVRWPDGRSPALLRTDDADGAHLAVVRAGEACVLDADLCELARAPCRGSLLAFETGVLQALPRELVYWIYLARHRRLVQRWRREVPRTDDVRIVGDRAVVRDVKTRILDRDGTIVTIDEPYFSTVAPFAGGIVVQRDRVVWHRDREGPQLLAHDVRAHHARAVPAGLATAERRALYIWRTDLDGPGLESAVATALPVHVPIYVATLGHVVIESAGRAYLRGRTPGGQVLAIEPDAPWRPATTRAEALAICDRLIARDFGPLPDLVPGDPENVHRLELLPLADSLAILGRLWLAPATLAPELRDQLAAHRDRLLDHLAAVLDIRTRLLLPAIVARTMRLAPPHPVPDHDYLGSFASSGALVAIDPCLLGRTYPRRARAHLLTELVGHDGEWHVFVRAMQADSTRNAELIVVHARGFRVPATEAVGCVSVDSATAGVFDRECPPPDPGPSIDAVWAGRGAFVSSGYGDNGYPVFAGSQDGAVARIRIVFHQEVDGAVDRFVVGAPASRPAKAYRASDHYAAGDTIVHPTLGTGTVVRTVDRKIEVVFAGHVVRLLVHQRA
jgi:hypothetical protein